MRSRRCGGGDNATAQSNAPTDVDILSFALNLEYLEAQFYIMAATGVGLGAGQLTGSGTQGAATGARAVNFTDPLVRQYAKEIAGDEVAHVAFLRSALGSAAVAQPAIDIGTGAGTPLCILATRHRLLRLCRHWS